MSPQSRHPFKLGHPFERGHPFKLGQTLQTLLVLFTFENDTVLRANPYDYMCLYKIIHNHTFSYKIIHSRRQSPF